MPRDHRASRPTSRGEHRGSGARPTFFCACVLEARCGGSFADAGFHLAIHARDLVTGEVPDEELDELDAILDDGDEDDLWAWLDRNLPRCTAMVPAEERDSFMDGVSRAVEDRRM